MYIKKASENILKELNSIGFDKTYMEKIQNKYCGNAYKIFNLKPYEANILKQLCLSLGFDCAVNRETITCKCEYTDALIFGSNAQLIKLANKLTFQPFRLKNLSMLIKNTAICNIEPLRIRNTVFNAKKAYVMGILNVTPDSFSDGGKYFDKKKAVEHALQMIAEGSDIIDIGGESTRPGAENISSDEEISRILPVITEIRAKNIDIPISIDTRNYETAKTAIEAGADIVNDVSGLDFDKNLFDYVAKNNLPVIIMHSDKVPAVSCDCVSSDIAQEVYLSLYNKICMLETAGMDKSKIISDIGIGFGKSLDSNFELLNRIKEFESLGTLLLLGISRKSFIKNTFNVNIEEADVITALYSAVLKSINIHRVHNPALVKKYLTYCNKLFERNSQEGMPQSETPQSNKND